MENIHEKILKKRIHSKEEEEILQRTEKQSQSSTNINSTSQNSENMIEPTVEEEDYEMTTKKKKLDYSKLYNLPKELPKSILKDIVERKYSDEDIKKQHNISYKTGFPPIIKIEDKELLTKSSLMKRTSDMFSIQYEYEHALNLQSSKNNSIEIQKSFSTCNKEKETNIENELIPETSQRKLSHYYLQKLAKMSNKEILEEKRILEKNIDPKLIQFLKNKNKKLEEKSVKQTDTAHNISIVNETAMDTETSNDKEVKHKNDTINSLVTKLVSVDIGQSICQESTSLNKSDAVRKDSKDDEFDIPESPKKILEESKHKGWLHMDTPEPEKLKWMKNLSEENVPISNAEYNARFNFDGILLPYKDDKLLDKGLHHHGEEPQRPGYTLQELLHWSRSSISQHRCIALTTMANIMEKSRKGWYDMILNPAPLIALSEKNIVLLLRFALDDSSVAVVTAALQALKAFLVSESDEICLDRMHEYEKHTQPTLMPYIEEKDTNKLKDHELAQLDAVAVLLRSNIVSRIKYILSKMHPSPIGVTCALEILIRLARHSHITSINIAFMPDLLDIIIHNFMPLSIDELAMKNAVNNAYGIPVITAVKLCRVLVMYGKQCVANKLDDFKVIQTILTYISSNTNKKDNINLSIESLRLWQLLLHYNIGLDSIAGAQLTFVSQLQLLLCNHDIQNASELECEYATALIVVASQEETLKSNISTLLTKWSTQLSSLSKIKFCVMKLIAITLSVVDEISAFKTTWLSNKCIFLTLQSYSNLLSNDMIVKREPLCLPNLGALIRIEELQPILCLNSCIPFLATIIEIFNKYSCVAEIRSIFEHKYFHNYLLKLEATDWSLERSWYSRMELKLLMAVVKAASMLKNTIDNQTARIIWNITIKLISALPADNADYIRELFQIALSKDKINLEIINNSVKIDSMSVIDQIKTGLNCDVASLYGKYIIQNGEWNQMAMPRDWLFLPLVNIYTNYKKNIKLQSEDKDNILTILSLMLILPKLMEQLSPSLRFSRLMLIYLCDTVHLNVSTLMLKIISNLLQKHYMEFNFSTELPGLNSFIDLFTELCVEFCASSYGNDDFTLMLLVPLAQRHDVHYRKMLWSEHADTLRYMRLPREKLVLPIKEYLYPEETDESLIKNYIKAIIEEKVKEIWCPVPYIIALHHSAMFLKCSNKTAKHIRTQIEKFQNTNIANKLLHYEPPQF